MKFLLDYFFPITAINPTPQASTAFLKQVCVVVKPKDAVPTEIVTLCTTMSQVAALTDNVEAQQLFNAGMSRVYVLPVDDLDLVDSLLEYGSQFFTILISSDFSDPEIEGEGAIPDAVKAQIKIQDITFEAVTAGVGGNAITIEYTDTEDAGDEAASVIGNAITVGIETGVSTAAQIRAAILASGPASALVVATVDAGDETDAQVTVAATNLAGGADSTTATQGLDLGAWKGVVGVSSTDDAFLEDQAVIENRSAFHTTTGNKAKNMFYAFGKMLSNPLNWSNQQYITMPFADDVDNLGEADNLFDLKISFVISDEEFGNRLSLFAAGGKAIVAPYVVRNLQIDMQSRALSYISGNQPGYTITQATLLEDELQKVIDSYIARQLIELGVVEVKLEQSNFVASGYINISEPNALWRIFGEIRQTL